MFKLIKILSSGVNVPEVQMAQKSAKAIRMGEALVMSGGKLVAPTATTKPTHIALADAEVADTVIPCAEISGNMVFECPVLDGTPTDALVGAKVCLALQDGAALGVNTTTTSGVATVYDTIGASATSDKILVTFK